MIGMKPSKSIKLDKVSLAKLEQYFDEKPLLEDDLHLYLLQVGEHYSDQKRHATDAYWSKKTYRLFRIITEPNSRVFYYLANDPDRSFVSKELIQVFKDVDVSPEHVKE